MPRHSTVFVSTALLLVLSGCDSQPETFLVHGMVVYPDGKPLTEGTVEFETLNLKKPITASGEINEDGTFQLGTYEVNDGAIAGKHRAAVIANYEIGTGAERPGLIPPPMLDPKFSDFITSTLEFEVTSSTNNILVEVDYAPPPGQDEVIDETTAETMLEDFVSE
jgi:hypothetical protein